MKTFFTLFFASSLTIILTLSWLGGFGLPAWVVGAFATLFVGGVTRAMRDYRRILK